MLNRGTNLSNPVNVNIRIDPTATQAMKLYLTNSVQTKSCSGNIVEEIPIKNAMYTCHGRSCEPYTPSASEKVAFLNFNLYISSSLASTFSSVKSFIIGPIVTI